MIVTAAANAKKHFKVFTESKWQHWIDNTFITDTSYDAIAMLNYMIKKYLSIKIIGFDYNLSKALSNVVLKWKEIIKQLLKN